MPKEAPAYLEITQQSLDSLTPIAAAYLGISANNQETVEPIQPQETQLGLYAQALINGFVQPPAVATLDVNVKRSLQGLSAAMFRYHAQEIKTYMRVDDSGVLRLDPDRTSDLPGNPKLAKLTLLVGQKVGPQTVARHQLHRVTTNEAQTGLEFINSLSVPRPHSPEISLKEKTQGGWTYVISQQGAIQQLLEGPADFFTQTTEVLKSFMPNKPDFGESEYISHHQASLASRVRFSDSMQTVRNLGTRLAIHTRNH